MTSNRTTSNRTTSNRSSIPPIAERFAHRRLESPLRRTDIARSRFDGAERRRKAMILVQISDSHIVGSGVLAYGVFDSCALLERVVAAVNAHDPQPDLVVHTGDLVHHGADAQYGRLLEILDGLKAPFFAVPGNHDSREGFARAFAGRRWLPEGTQYLQYAIEDFPVRVLCLDTVQPGKLSGALGPARLEWLNSQLGAQPTRPTIVACHHPPFATGLTGLTKIGLDRGGREFASVLSRHVQVRRLICGHVHRPIAATFGNVAAWAGPATSFQFEAGMSEERILALTREPPGYSVHAWIEDPVSGPGLVSHCVPVGDFGERVVLLRGGEPVARTRAEH